MSVRFYFLFSIHEGSAVFYSAYGGSESPRFFFPFIVNSWRLITSQYCIGFRHTLTWISHGFTCVPHPEPPSHLPPHPIPLGHPSVPALSTCLMHPTWTGDLFHIWYYICFNAILSDHPILAFSHRVQKSILYTCVYFSVLHIALSLPSLNPQVL